jgi:hypothetical protein
MCGGALPCPHLLPSCLPPPPFPDPGRASQPLCSRAWELQGGGSPGKRSPCATRRGRTRSPHFSFLPPSVPPQRRPLHPPPLLSRPGSSFRTRTPVAPDSHSQASTAGIPASFFPLRHLRGLQEEGGRGKPRDGETTSPSGLRASPRTFLNPRPLGPAAEPGLSWSRRRTQGSPQRRGRPGRWRGAHGQPGAARPHGWDLKTPSWRVGDTGKA